MWNTMNLSNFNSSLSQQLYEDYLQKINYEVEDKQERVRDRCIAPSSIRCMRKSWFRLRGSRPSSPISVDNTLQFFAQMGDACHRIVQNRLIEMYGDLWLDVEKYLTTVYSDDEFDCEVSGFETRVRLHTLPIKFSVDGLINIDGKPVIVEIKSVEYSVFQNLYDIKEEHLDQAICYASLLKVDSVVFIYIDRTYGDIKCFELIVTDDMKSDMMQRIDNIVVATKTNLAPPKLPSGDSWCSSNRCEYYKICKEY